MDINGENNKQPSRQEPDEKFEKWLKNELRGLYPMEMPEEAGNELFEKIDRMEPEKQSPEKKSILFHPGFRLSSIIDGIAYPSPARSLAKVAVGLAAGLIIGFFLFNAPQEHITTPGTQAGQFATEQTGHTPESAADSTATAVPSLVPVDSGTVEQPDQKVSVSPGPEPPLPYFAEKSETKREEEVSLGFADTKKSPQPRAVERWATFTLRENMQYGTAWATMTTLLTAEGFIFEYLDKSSGMIRTGWKQERTTYEKMVHVRVQARFIMERRLVRVLYEAKNGKEESISMESLAGFRKLKALIREQLQ